MTRTITFLGKPMTLVGRTLKTGNSAPDFTAFSNDLKEISLANFPKKIKVITSFPSLDTQVCDLQVKEFNKKAAGSDKVVILAISKDLPFAQKRFCDTFGIKNIELLSDYKTSSFGINYGLLIKELNLLARAVLILDENNSLRYLQIANEITNSLDFEDVLLNLKKIENAPTDSLQKETVPSKCLPCEGKIVPLTKKAIDAYLLKVKNWESVDNKKIVKEFKFKDFLEAKYFLDMIATIAEEQGHHPTMTLSYQKVKIALTTHRANGLTDNDFIMAKIIDEVE